MRAADITAPARGAYAELDQLIGLRFSARQLRLSRRNRALSVLAGPNKSNFRGRGIDFEEVRAYQPGDDIRTIDWRVTARTGKAHTKLFREERERPVLVVVDQRNSLFFGSSHCFKSVLAAQFAALLAWSALNNGDRVGGLVDNGLEHREIRPRRSRKTVLGLLSQVAAYNQALPLAGTEPTGNFADMLGKVRRIAKPGSAIFLISDFTGAESQLAQEQLFQLAQHTEITAIACSDPLERQLPRAGHYVVTDGAARSELYTADKRLRRQYQTRIDQRWELLSQNLQKLGIPLLQGVTDQSAFALLQRFYGEPRR